MALDRTIAPEAKEIDNINFILPKKWELDNSIPVYEYNLGSQNLSKIEFSFNAGTKYQEKALIASSIKNLIKEGTTNYTSKQIADAIDFYGAFLETDISNDHASISLYSLNKYMDNVLPIVVDIIMHANFPQDEIDNYLKRSKQNFLVGQEKVSTLASQAYVSNIFRGSSYDQVATVNDYEHVTREDLVTFYQQYYSLENMEIFLAGKIDDNIKGLLNQYLGKIKTNSANKPSFTFSPIQFSASNDFVLKESAIQSAIRYGKPTININHPDYIKFQVLNTALGGYFGSRLMMNIREDKGYTYGIGSGISSKIEAANFVIATEVGSDVTHSAIKEINIEIDRIKHELIPEDELHVVKNYMLGSLLKNTDGPFDLLERFKTIHYNKLNDAHYDHFIKEIKNTTATELKELANKHLTNMSIILAGSVDFN